MTFVASLPVPMSWSGALVPSSSIYVITAEDASVEVDELLDYPVDAAEPPTATAGSHNL